MAPVTNSDFAPSTILETSTFPASFHFDYGNDSGVLYRREPVNGDIPYLHGSNFGNSWPLLPTPAHPPSRQDWDNHRDIFTRLYQVEERPLKEVKKLLQQHYSFQATDRMYKRRIKDWRVMKYYKREEKEAVCHALKRRGLAGKDRHQIMIRNQPAKVYRILRHIKSSGGQMDGPVSGCPRTSADEEEEVEVCTPGGGTTFDDEASLCSAARHLLSGSRASPSPGRPILTNDDLGKAEIICLEVSRYFEILLPSYALTRQGQLSAKYHIPVNTFNHVSIVSSLVLTRRYAEARLYLSKAFDLLKGMLHEQSPKLLPTLLGTGLVFEDERTPFKVGDSFFKHTADLCEICLGVQHPITVVLRLYRGVVCKNQVANAALGRLLENTTRSAEYGESHDLSIYLVRLKCDALMRLGFFEEAEKTVKLAVASCKSLHGTSHELTIQLFGTLAVVGMSGLYDYSRAKALYQNLLHSLEHANDVWSLCGTLTALRGLGRIAYIEFNFQEAEGLFRKALDLAGIIFNDGAPETTHVACDFAYLSRLAEKIWKQTFCSTLSSEY